MNGNRDDQIGFANYHVQQLTEVGQRLSHLEGELKHLATKKDVESAKLSMMTVWVSTGALILVGAIDVAIMLWRALD
ncbi:MAG: hypothetical protein OXC83_00490 [Chloroflexi bacterium]|nr:hypothetical protein [Chloroflexota bacterium]